MSWDPQQFQSWTTTRPRQPSGWQGPWPPRPPPGPPAPPPGVDAHRWLGGQWRFNPVAVQSVARPVQPVIPSAWAVHPSWGRVVYPANFNPWKKVPRPTRSSYWDTQLSKNPLGLEGMDYCTEEPTFGPPRPQEEIAQTPWVWAPKDLSESPERRETAPDPRDGHGIRDSQKHQNRRDPSRERSQMQPAPASATIPMSSTRQAANGDASRPHYTIYSSTSQTTQRERSKSAENPSSAPATISSYSQVPQASHTARTQHRSAQSQDASQDSRNVAASRPNESRDSRERLSDDNSVFNTRQELQPTFSPKVVRTPHHYASNAVSSASAAAAGVASSKTPAVTPTKTSALTSHTPASSRRPSREEHGPIYGPSTTPTRAHGLSSSMSHTASKFPSAPSTVSTSTTSLTTSTPLHNFTEEPASMLSPILSPGAPDSNGSSGLSRSRTSPNLISEGPSPKREVSRSQTYPHIPASSKPPAVPSIPEERAPSSSSSQTRTPRPPDVFSSTSQQDPVYHSSTSSHRHDTDPAPVIRKSSSGGSSSKGVPRSRTYPSLDLGTSNNPATGFTTESRLNRRHRSKSPSPGIASRAQYPAPPRDMISSLQFPDSVAAARLADAPAHSSSQQRSSQPKASAVALSRSQTQPVVISSSSYYSSQSAVSIPPAHSTQVSSQPVSAFVASHTQSGRSAGMVPAAAESHTQPVQPSQHIPQPSYANSSSRPAQPAHATSNSTQYSSTQRSPVPPSSHTSTPSRPSYNYSSYSSQQPVVYSSTSQAAAASTTVSARNNEVPSNSARQDPLPRRRVGYWNRRGDHLLTRPSTIDGSPRPQWIVYAPRSLANPPELKDYPTPTEGFMDHEGHKIKYDPNIAELPDSLPRHGEEPKRPYDSFIKYI